MDIPYEGAREMLAADIDDGAFCCRVIRAISEFRKEEKPRITGYEFHVLCLASYVCPKYLILDKLEETLEELKTREPDEKMLECAIVSVNVVLYGLPKHAKKTPEGWAVLNDYRESEKDYVPPVQEEAETESAGADEPSEGAPEEAAAAEDAVSESAS